MVFDIEDGKSVPTAKGGVESKYPFGALEVGQSFFIPNAKRGWPLSSTANTRHKPKKFTQRQVVEEGIAGIRVWRTK